MAEKRNIKQWSEDDRPREKLRDKGAASLSNAELLAILVGSGTPELNAVEMMKSILADCGQALSRLSRLTIADLCRYKGVGEAKAITILAACELGRRRAKEESRERLKIESSATVADYFRPQMRDLPHEECWVMYLNQANKEICTKRVSEGGLTATVVDVRRILHEAIRYDATCMVLCHNHPSGNPRPSGDDDNITRKLRKAGEIIGIRLLDHIIIADCDYYSYADEGRLNV